MTPRPVAVPAKVVGVEEAVRHPCCGGWTHIGHMSRCPAARHVPTEATQ